MNNKNLIPINKRDPEEAHALRSKGGKNCMENRRKRKALRLYVEELLAQKADGEKGTIAEVLVVKTINALLKDPNIKDFKTLCEVLGEVKPEKETDSAQVVINVNADGLTKDDIDKLL